MSPFYGSIVVIKRSGQDGSVFSLVREECLMGRSEDCDIRIQLLDVSSEHARLDVDPVSKKVVLTSLGKNGVKVGDSSIPIGQSVTLRDKDVFKISDRFFRFESAPLMEEGRKRVSFGPVISPEYIDKSLPPSTPVKKGAVPSSLSVMTPLSHIKRRMPKLRGATPQHGPIFESHEEEKPVGVLVRHENDTPRIKESSGSRTSPRRDHMEEKKAVVKRSLSLSKNPSRFYGASAAKTPKGAVKRTLTKTPKKISKTPRKVSTKVTKTPTHLKASAKKSWADILKKNVGKTPKAIRVARETQLEDEKRRVQVGLKKNLKKNSSKSKKAQETESFRNRHAQSPEDIVIHRRRSIKATTATPKRLSHSPSPKKSMSKSSPLVERKVKRQSVSPLKKAGEGIKRGRSRSVSSVAKGSNKSNHRRSLSTPHLKTNKSGDLPIMSSVTRRKKRFTLVTSESHSSNEATQSSPTSKQTRRSISPSKKLVLSAKSSNSPSISLDSLEFTSPSPSSKRGRPRGTKLDSSVSKMIKLSSPSPVRSTPSSPKRGRPRKAPSPSPNRFQDIKTPSSAKRGRPRKAPSPSSNRSQDIKTPSSAKQGRPRKAPSTSPTKSQDIKTPSSAKRGRPRKAQSLSPTRFQDIKTPSSAKRGRPRKASSPSPTRSQDIKTPLSAKRGRPRKVPSSSPTHSQEIKTPSSAKRGRPKKSSSHSPSHCQDIKTPSSGSRDRRQQTPSKRSSSALMLSPRSAKASSSTKRSRDSSTIQRKTRSSSTGTIKTPNAQMPLPSSKAMSSEKSALSSKKAKAKRSKSLSNLSNSNRLKENDPRQSLSVRDLLALNKSRSMTKIRKSFAQESPVSIVSKDSSLDSIILPTSSKTPANSPANGISPLTINRNLSKSIRESFGSFENSSFFDFDAVKTPNIPIQVLVSPLLSDSIQEERGALASLRSKPATRMSLNTDAMREYHEVSLRRRHSIDRIDMQGRRSARLSPNKKSGSKILDKKKTRHIQKSPKSSYDNFVGIKELLKTPKKFEDMLREGDLEALYASPEFNVLTTKKRENFLKKIQMVNTISSNRKLSLSNLKPKLSDVLKRRSLECNIDLFGSNHTKSEEKVKKSRISLNNVNDEVENKSPTSISRRSSSKTETNSKKDKKASPNKLKEPMVGNQADLSVETSSSDLNQDSSVVTNLSSKDGLNDKGKPIRKEPTAKRSTRSKTVKKVAAEVPEVSETPPKRATRSRNKSENEKTKNSKVVKNEEVMESKPTPKRSTRGRKNAKTGDDSKATQKNSDSDEVEEKQPKKRSKPINNEEIEIEPDERPKTRGRRPKAAISDTSSPAPKATRRNRKDKKNAASEVELKQSEVESSAEQSERGVQTNSSDTDEPDSADQIRSLPKRSSRRNQNTEPSKKSPVKRTTRSARSQGTEPKDPEVSNEISGEESTKGRRTRRGRHNSPQVTESAQDELVHPTPKQRRTRRAAAKSPEAPTPSTLTKDNKSASTTRRGRKKKELSQSSDDAAPKDEGSTAKKSRKRNAAQSETTKETESSPPKRGRKAKKQEKSVDKTESPIKRVTRSRAKK